MKSCALDHGRMALSLTTLALTALMSSSTATAEDVTYRAIGTINSPSPLAGETMTVYYTFDSGTPPSSIGGDCSAVGRGYIPANGTLYPESIRSVSYSIDGAPAVSLGAIDNMSANGASAICLASDSPTAIGDQNDYANLYDASATGIGGYYVDVNMTAESAKRVVIVPGTELITDLPKLPLFERDLGNGTIAGSATIFVIDPNGMAVGGAPATLTSIVKVTNQSAPTVIPSVKGTMGSNGWYVTRPTTLQWAVSGKPAPTKSGCNTVSVPDTAGTTYTCSATNELGTYSDAVTIKKDSVAPAVQLKVPASGASYAVNQVVKSQYTCTDAISGLASCAGPVASGADIATATAGPQTFSVTAVDGAGNTTTKPWPTRSIRRLRRPSSRSRREPTAARRPCRSRMRRRAPRFITPSTARRRARPRRPIPVRRSQSR